MCTSTVHNNPPKHSSANAALPFILTYKPPTLLLHCYKPLLHSPSNHLPLRALFPRPEGTLPFLTRLGFSSGVQEVFARVVLNFFSFICYFLSFLSVSCNPASTLLHLSWFLVALLSDRIVLTLCLTLFHFMTRTRVIVQLFSSQNSFP